MNFQETIKAKTNELNVSVDEQIENVSNQIKRFEEAALLRFLKIKTFTEAGFLLSAAAELGFFLKIDREPFEFSTVIMDGSTSKLVGTQNITFRWIEKE